MSKRAAKQKSVDGGGDDQEASGSAKSKIPICRDPSKLSKSLRLLQQKYGEEFGSLVDEMCISVFSIPDEEIEDAPEDETDDDKEDRRARNTEAREINRECKNYRDRLIKIVQQILRAMIGHIPTTKRDLENYLRRMPRKAKRDDISSYHASFATMEEVNSLKQEVKRLREETNSSYATTTETKASKQSKLEVQQKHKDRVCHICKSTGHLKWKCPEQKCKVCQKKGHCPNDCPTLKDE